MIRWLQRLEMPGSAAILSLLIGIAGWYYLFYSKAAAKLVAIELISTNRLRSRLRRFNGGVLVLLAAAFYSGFSVDPETHRKAFAILWVIVFFLLLIVVALAVIDLRLTTKLRKKL